MSYLEPTLILLIITARVSYSLWSFIHLKKCALNVFKTVTQTEKEKPE